jgi:Fe-Mn family superoxide dismutase
MAYQAKTFTFPEVPGLSAEQLELHIGLYEGYVKHVNKLLNEVHHFASLGEDHTYASQELRRRFGFEWNGMRLHELYFEVLEGGAQVLNAETKLFRAIQAQFGGLVQWFEEFSAVTARGPGWAILNYDPVSKQFFHTWVGDHELGQLATLPALLVVDHWEHAFMKDYKPSEKGQYVQAYLSAINWDVVAKRFDAIAS